MFQKKLNLQQDQVIQLRMILLNLNVSLDSLRSNLKTYALPLSDSPHPRFDPPVNRGEFPGGLNFPLRERLALNQLILRGQTSLILGYLYPALAEIPKTRPYR